jgi:hypothetical protein
MEKKNQELRGIKNQREMRRPDEADRYAQNRNQSIYDDADVQEINTPGV